MAWTQTFNPQLPLFETDTTSNPTSSPGRPCRACGCRFDPSTLPGRLRGGGYCSWSCERRPLPSTHCARCGEPVAKRGEPRGQGRPRKFCRACSCSWVKGRQTTPCVYFLKNCETNRIKVGTSRSPRRRAANLQIASDCPLQLLGWITGGKDTERDLHELFAQSRVRGEWFDGRIEPRVLELLGISTICGSPPSQLLRSLRARDSRSSPRNENVAPVGGVGPHAASGRPGGLHE